MTNDDHPVDCSGCPECDEELAALFTDTNPQSLSVRLLALTARVRESFSTGIFRRASGTVAPPPDLGAAIVKLREPPSREQAIKEGLARGRSEPGPAPVADPVEYYTDPPSCPCKKP